MDQVASGSDAKADADLDTAASLPLLNAKAWALGFTAFAIVLTVFFAVYMIDFMARAH